MAINTFINLKRKELSFLIIFICILFSINSQSIESNTINLKDEIPTEENENNSANYFARETENGNIEVIQTLTWPQVDYVKYYEVFLEQLISEENADVNQQWQQLESYKTEKNSLELKLISGQYRYRITLYNLLGKAEYTSDWREFYVKKAYIPYLDDISPKLIYLDDINDGEFKLKGANLLPESIFTINKVFTSIASDSVNLGFSGRSAQVVFPFEKFDTGDWLVTVTNPGGFSAKIPLHIQFFKWFDFNIQFGYKPAFVLYDDTINTYFNTNKLLLGADAKLTFIPYKRRFGYYGISLDVMFHNLSNSMPGYDIGMNMFQSYIHFLYRIPIIKNKLLLDAFAGPGIFAVQGLMFKFPHNIQSSPFFSYYMAASAGLSCKLFVHKRLYIEMGAEYTVAFIPDMSIMTIMPSLSLGWQL